MMMERVLFTALRVNDQEINVLADARLKAYNSGYMSYIWAAEENLVAQPIAPRAVNPGEKTIIKR